MIYEGGISSNINGESINYELIKDGRHSTLECRLNRTNEHRQQYLVAILFFTFLMAIIQVQQKVKITSVVSLKTLN